MGVTCSSSPPSRATSPPNPSPAPASPPSAPPAPVSPPSVQPAQLPEAENAPMEPARDVDDPEAAGDAQARPDGKNSPSEDNGYQRGCKCWSSEGSGDAHGTVRHASDREQARVAISRRRHLNDVVVPAHSCSSDGTHSIGGLSIGGASSSSARPRPTVRKSYTCSALGGGPSTPTALQPPNDAKSSAPTCPVTGPLPCSAGEVSQPSPPSRTFSNLRPWDLEKLRVSPAGFNPSSLRRNFRLQTFARGDFQPPLRKSKTASGTASCPLWWWPPSDGRDGTRPRLRRKSTASSDGSAASGLGPDTPHRNRLHRDSDASSARGRKTNQGQFTPRRFSASSAAALSDFECEADKVTARLRQHRRAHVDMLPTCGEEFEHFKDAVLHSTLCAGLIDDEVAELASRAELYQFDAGDTVVEASEIGTHFFVIQCGVFSRILRDDSSGSGGTGHQALPPMSRGDSFGDAQIVHNCRQWLTVQAGTVGQCWAVERSAFERIMRRAITRNHSETFKLLESVRMFQYIVPQSRSDFCKHLVTEIVPAGCRVTSQGLQHTEYMFIVKSGSVAVVVGGRQVATLERKDHFGERSVLYGEPRAATIVALEQSEIIRISIGSVRKLLGKSFEHILWHNVVSVSLRQFVQGRGRPFCKRTDNDNLAAQFLIKDLSPGAKVEENEAGGLRFGIVLNGSALLKGRGDADGKVLDRGECFGEEYMDNMDLPFQHTIENGSSDKPCKLALLSSDALMSWAFSKEQDEMTQAQKMSLVRKVYVFRHLSKHHCTVIAKSFRTIMRMQGEKVIEEGQVGSEFFVISSGELVVTIKGKTIRTLGVSDYFGERGLLYNEPRTATVTCQSKQAELMVINKAVFMQIIEDQMLQHLEERIRLQQTDVNFDDLRVLRIIGRGAFGVVKLVEHKKSKTNYALKCISKSEAVKNKQQENLRLEREILLENDHPFIVKVVRTFRDQQYVYFLTELVAGGELYDSIRSIGILTQSQSQFYSGSLILALESLHERSIVYRDLKPENVMLDGQGYIKLIDFGCAVKLRLGDSLMSIVGTPHYMAPEVILGCGYGKTCDVWSLGVVLYEFICGPLPFGHEEEEPMAIFRALLQNRLTFPGLLNDFAAEEVLRKLLCRSTERRLGCCESGWKAVQSHPYYRNFCFDRLLSRKLAPPLVPEAPLPSVADVEDEGNLDVDEADRDADDDDAAESSSGLSDSSAEAPASKKPQTIQQSDWDRDF